MILRTDIPTRLQVERLLRARDPASASIYVPTDPASSGQAERIEFGNLAAEAVGQLRAADAARDRVAAIEEGLADLAEHDVIWRNHARSDFPARRVRRRARAGIGPPDRDRCRRQAVGGPDRRHAERRRKRGRARRMVDQLYTDQLGELQHLCEQAPARDVVAEDGQHTSAGEPYAVRDLIDDPLTVCSGLPERDRSGSAAILRYTLTLT